MTTATQSQDPAAARRAQRLGFVRYIEQACRNDPGARAALRSGVRRGLDQVPRMHRLVAPRLPRPSGQALPERDQRAYYTIAAMIADQPRHRLADGDGGADDDGETAVPTPPDEGTAGSGQQSAGGAPTAQGDRDAGSPADRYGTSLGAAFAAAVAKAPGRDREMRASTAEQRLNLLTRQSVNGLHRHLPASVRYLLSIGAPVDFAQLMDDLIAWPVHSGRIARRWLQDYYRLRDQAVAAEAAAADDQAPLDPAPAQ